MKPAGSDIPLPRFQIALAVSAALILILAGLNLWVLSRLPETARIPMHWNFKGEIDGWGGRGSLWILPGALVAITALLYFLPRLERRRENFVRSAGAYQAVWIGGLVLLSMVHVIVLLAALGHQVPMNLWMGTGLGILFVLIGRVLGKIESNHLIGIRTPWTLGSDHSWLVTHRLGGHLMTALGIALALVSVLGLPAAWLWGALVIGLVAMILATVICSYVVWRADPDKSAGRGERRK